MASLHYTCDNSPTFSLIDAASRAIGGGEIQHRQREIYKMALDDDGKWVKRVQRSPRTVTVSVMDGRLQATFGGVVVPMDYTDVEEVADQARRK